MSDLEIIKELETLLGRTFKQVELNVAFWPVPLFPLSPYKRFKEK